MHMCVYIYVYKLLATVVKGDSKAPFSFATTSMCRGRRYSFLWFVPLYS